MQVIHSNLPAIRRYLCALFVAGTTICAAQAAWILGCGSSKKIGSSCTTNAECPTGVCDNKRCISLASEVIDSGGGSLSVAGNELTVTLPAGAVASATTITLKETPTVPSGNLGTAYELGPAGTIFGVSVVCVFRYDKIDLKGNSPSSLQVGRIDDGVWVALTNITVDTNAKTVSGTTSKIGILGLLPKTPSIKFTVPAQLPAATLGVPYLYSFCKPDLTQTSDLCDKTATNPGGGDAAYSFMLGSGTGFPPVGLSLKLNGLLTGTPTAEGEKTFEVCVKDLDGDQACATTSLTVNPVTNPWITIGGDVAPLATVTLDGKVIKDTSSANIFYKANLSVGEHTLSFTCTSTYCFVDVSLSASTGYTVSPAKITLSYTELPPGKTETFTLTVGAQ